MVDEERLDDIPEGTTIIFTDTLLLDEVVPDITSDTVTITIKASKDDPDPGLLQISANVAIQGASGQALFELTSAQTTIEPGDYLYEIMWIRADGKKYRPHFGSVRITQRVSDL